MVHYISVPKKLPELLSKMSITTSNYANFCQSGYGELRLLFLASNHQNLIPFDGLKPFLMVGYFRTLKNSLFVKSLNFIVLRDPSGPLKRRFAARNTVQADKSVKKLSDTSATWRYPKFSPTKLIFGIIDLWGDV